MQEFVGHAARRILNTLSAVAAVALLALLLVLWPNDENAAREASASAARLSYTVVLDAGHGGEDGGAVGVSGVVEAGLNLEVCMRVKAALEQRGATVVLTRKDEHALAGSKQADMAARRKIMNAENVDAVVSVHMNKFKDRAVHGPMAFYMVGSSEGEKLAKCVIDAVCDAIGAPRRIANPADYYVIRESDPVAVLVECGFLSNSEDEILLQNAQHQQKIADGIANGVMQYLENVNLLD